MRNTTITTALLVCLTTSFASAQAEKEDEYYKLLRFNVPEGVVLEVGAIEPLPNGRVAVSSRRGEIYIVDNAYSGSVDDAKFTRFAHGCLLYTSPSPRDATLSRMPSSA